MSTIAIIQRIQVCNGWAYIDLCGFFCNLGLNNLFFVFCFVNYTIDIELCRQPKHSQNICYIILKKKINQF